MTCAIDDPHQPQIGHVLAHDLHKVDAGYKRENRIEASRDESGRLFDLAVCDLLLLGKVELCRAVTVERSAKAALLELPGIVVEVGGREPIREWIGIREAIEIFGVGRFLRPRPRLPALAGSRG